MSQMYHVYDVIMICQVHVSRHVPNRKTPLERAIAGFLSSQEVIEMKPNFIHNSKLEKAKRTT